MSGGGVHAHLRDEQAWFFTRQAILDDTNNDITNSDSWDTPYAVFPGDDSYNIVKGFKQYSIVFDTTLCGDRAGLAYASSGTSALCD